MFWKKHERGFLRDPVTIIVTAITSGVGAVAGGAAAVAFAAVQVAAIAYTVFSTYAAYKAGKKAEAAAKRAELESRERNARRNFRAAVAAKRIVYGRDRLGGAFIFADNPNKEDAVIIVSLADHEIEEIESFQLADEIIETNPTTGEATGKYAGHLWIWPQFGAPGQDLSGLLISLGCTTVQASDRFEGTACLVIRTRNLLRDFPDAEIQFNAVFKGKNDILDPRTGLRGWTDNASLCAADYTQVYQGFRSEQINQDELIASANVCDEEVRRKNGTLEKRYTLNGVITANQEHRAILPDLALAMAGNIAWVGGEWLFVAGRHREPSASFTADDILGDFEYNYTGSARDIPNVGKGTFKSPLHNWQSVSIPEFIDQDRLDKAGGERRELDLTLPFTNSGSMAQRILRIATKRAQQEEGCSLKLKPSALQVKTADTALFDIPRHGITQEIYEVRDFSTNLAAEKDGIRFDCSVQIQRYNSTIFDFDEMVDEKDIPAASVRLGEVSPNVPTEVELFDDGPNFRLEWKNPSPTGKEPEKTQIEIVREDAMGVETEAEYTTPGLQEQFLFDLLNANTLVSLRLRTLFDNNSTSQWVSP